MSSRVVIRRTGGWAAAFTLAASLTIGGGQVAAADSEDPLPSAGTACAPGTGVTVVVDATLDGATGQLTVGCATGPQSSVLQALESAGFNSAAQPVPGGAVFCGSEKMPGSSSDCSETPGSVWRGVINTLDGQSAGPLDSSWHPIAFELDIVPIAVDTYIGFAQAGDGTTLSFSPRLLPVAAAPEDYEPSELETAPRQTELASSSAEAPVAEAPLSEATQPTTPTLPAGDPCAIPQACSTPPVISSPESPTRLNDYEVDQNSDVYSSSEVPSAAAPPATTVSPGTSELSQNSTTTSDSSTVTAEMTVAPVSTSVGATSATAIPIVQTLSETGVTNRVIPFSFLSAGMMLVGALILVLAKPRHRNRH